MNRCMICIVVIKFEGSWRYSETTIPLDQFTGKEDPAKALMDHVVGSEQSQ
jgi:hypothetical protein